jgi:hypothetical protein
VARYHLSWPKRPERFRRYALIAVVAVVWIGAGIFAGLITGSLSLPPPDPRIYLVGETAIYADGLSLSTTAFEELISDSYYQPGRGMRYVLVLIRLENRSAKLFYLNPDDFKLQDSSGALRQTGGWGDSEPGGRTRRVTTANLVHRTDALPWGPLRSEASVSGSIVFEAPIGDDRLKLIFEEPHRGPTMPHPQVTFRLY